MLSTEDIANIPVTIDYLLKVRKEAVRLSGSMLQFNDKAVAEVFNDVADILTAALAVYKVVDYSAAGYAVPDTELEGLIDAIQKFEG